jgi:hypothetical protein
VMYSEGGASEAPEEGPFALKPAPPSQVAAADAPSTCTRPMVPLSASQLQPEELRAGETIAYYSMAFVFGNPQGYREAVVVKVNTSPGADKQLDLDSSDIIALTQILKRLVDHSGRRIAEGRALWRKLRSFTLVPGSTTLRHKPARSTVPSRRQSGRHSLLPTAPNILQARKPPARSKHGHEPRDCPDASE